MLSVFPGNYINLVVVDDDPKAVELSNQGHSYKNAGLRVPLLIVSFIV